MSVEDSKPQGLFFYRKYQTFKPINWAQTYTRFHFLTVSLRYATHAPNRLHECTSLVCVCEPACASLCEHLSSGGSVDGAICWSRPASPPSLLGWTHSFCATSLGLRPLSVSSTLLRRRQRSADALGRVTHTRDGRPGEGINEGLPGHILDYTTAA